MAGIKWSDPAIDDLKEISSYISRDSPKYARSITKGIMEMIDHLQRFPRIGKKVPELEDPDIRVIIYRNYRIFYQIYEQNLEIIRIIHGSRNFILKRP